MRPENRQYTAEHEWLQIDGDEVVIGITDYAAQELGDIVFLDLPEVGRELKPGESLGSVETVKAVEEIYSPVGGTVSEVNAVLADRPELVNDSPFEDGWLLKIKTTGDSVGGLMSAAAYGEMLEGA